MEVSENQWWQKETNDDVATSPSLWRPISDRVNGFDLDPAAGAEPEAIAAERYTANDNGLSKEWFGTVWLNPPFSEKNRWYKKLVSNVSDGTVDRAVAVAPVDPSAQWFHRWFSNADVIVFLEGRDFYLGYDGTPTFSTMLGLWHPTETLVEWAHENGTVMLPTNDENGTQTTL